MIAYVGGFKLGMIGYAVLLFYVYEYLLIVILFIYVSLCLSLLLSGLFVILLRLVCRVSWVSGGFGLVGRCC